MDTNRGLPLELKNKQLENEVKNLENELNLLKKRTFCLDLRNRDLQKRYRAPKRKNKAIQVDNRKAECTDNESESDDSNDGNKCSPDLEINVKKAMDKKFDDLIEISNYTKQINSMVAVDYDDRSEIKFIIDETRSDYLYSMAEKYPFVTTLILEGNSAYHYNLDKHVTAAFNLTTLIYLCAEKFQCIEWLKLVNVGWKLPIADIYLISNCFSGIKGLSLFWVEIGDEHLSILLDKLDNLKKIEVIGVPITGQCFDNIRSNVESLTWRFSDRIRTYQEFKFQ